MGKKTGRGILAGVSLVTLILSFSAALATGSDAQNEILARLRDLERRLERLEAERARGEREKAETQEAELGELRRQVDILAGEIVKLRSGEQERTVSQERTRSLGLGPGASTVYRKQSGVSLAGYGEMLYQNFNSRDQSGHPASRETRLDFQRAILYAGYRFDEHFLFNSEIEFEHASTDKAGEVSAEFAYIDYLANPHLTLRGGLLLVPMGLINEFHEPTVFLGSRRPETEQAIIPSTWRENGAGVLGRAGPFSYRAYLVNGLDASGFRASGLREGRQLGSKARATDLAFVGRLDVSPVPGFFFGGSLYRGGSDQGRLQFEGRKLDVSTTIWELHAQLQRRGWDVRGLFARATLDDVAALNQALGLAGSDSIGRTLQGGYFQAGYNLLSQFRESVELLPFYRFERLDTQHAVAAGFLADPAQDRTLHTLGLEFKPISGVVLKGDYQWVRNRASSGLNQFNLTLGYSF